MTAPTTLVRAGEVWPTTRIGWTALIDTLRERAARVYGPAVAQRIDDGLKIARLHAADFPEEWTAGDVRGFAWLYGPLLTEDLARDKDNSRRLSGSDYARARAVVDVFSPREVYVYAMGQEPWVEFISSLKYTSESLPIVESDKLLGYCHARDIVAERLFGEKELLYHTLEPVH